MTDEKRKRGRPSIPTYTPVVFDHSDMSSDEFKTIRQSLEISQAELSRELNVTRQYVSILERGHQNIPTYLGAMMRVLLKTYKIAAA